MSPQPIDRDKLCVFARTLDVDMLHVVLERAVARVPSRQLPELLEGIRHDNLEADESVAAAAEKFAKDSAANKYYEDFDVNWKNSTQTSRGTRAWFAEWERIVALAAEAARVENFEEAAVAFRTLFRLSYEAFCDARHIFIADEAGYWSLHVDWKQVLPPWFLALARTTSAAEEFADIVSRAIEDVVPDQREWFLAEARRVATIAQATALDSRSESTR